MRIEPPDPDSTQPPFDQLRSQIARRAASGDLAPGTRLPTVRALAGELGLAANTVARAYRELEADGVVVTEGRRGTFVASTAAAASGDARDAAAAYVATARSLGLAREEVHRLVDEAWPR
ncbi:GntR family transcriptional regulator [Nocardioides coralli]|uniref:GntR family transcriptional regulator n=1 Tax=Nocardioides coralli TaxID=2872154 RepID=UPI001CA3C40B|nr:GntR family transcriptional regulator [Nocardioides coralli]QZY28608.1 GntR family transcriptional regulator [Nocardioides coralli]